MVIFEISVFVLFALMGLYQLRHELIVRRILRDGLSSCRDDERS